MANSVIPAGDLMVPFGVVCAALFSIGTAAIGYLIKKLSDLSSSIDAVKAESHKNLEIAKEDLYRAVRVGDDQRIVCSKEHAAKETALLAKIETQYMDRETMTQMVGRVEDKIGTFFDLMKTHLTEEKERSERIFRLLEAHGSKLTDHDISLSILKKEGRG